MSNKKGSSKNAPSVTRGGGGGGSGGNGSGSGSGSNSSGSGGFFSFWKKGTTATTHTNINTNTTSSSVGASSVPHPSSTPHSSLSYVSSPNKSSPQMQPNIRPSMTKQLGRWMYDRSRLQQMNDTDVLKRLREHILFRLDNLSSIDSKLRSEIHIALNEVWALEFAILKQRLKKTTLRARSEKMEEETAEALASLVVTRTVNRKEYHDDEDFLDARQTALWLMNNFLPKATVETMVDTNALHSDLTVLDEEDQQKIVKETIAPIQKFRRSAKRVMVALIMQKNKLNSTISLLHHHEPLQTCLAKIGDWDFNVFDLYDIEICKDQCLVLATNHILTQLDMIRKLDLSHRKLWNFLRDVENNYNDIPYHNKLHALDVTNTLYFVLKSEFMRNHVSALDQMASIIAAAVHDLGHDGYNNAYHMNIGSDIALTYNDSSVLENYHISRAFFLLKKNNNNWYQRLSRPMRNYFRNVMISLVLATDMNFHFRELARLRQMLSAFRQETKTRMSTQLDDLKQDESPASRTVSDVTPVSMDSMDENLGIFSSFAVIPLEKSKARYTAAHTAIKDEALTKVIVPEKQVETESSRISGVDDERLFMLGAAIHACDISNPTKELRVCSEWADRIMREFFDQGDKEKALGLPVSPMMDRDTASKASGQIGFIRFIVAPLFDVYSDLIPELKPCCAVMQSNLEYWENAREQAISIRTQRKASRAKLEPNIPSLNSTASNSSNTNTTTTTITNDNSTSPTASTNTPEKSTTNTVNTTTATATATATTTINSEKSTTDSIKKD